jgi:hypothetical protein
MGFLSCDGGIGRSEGKGGTFLFGVGFGGVEGVDEEEKDDEEDEADAGEDFGDVGHGIPFV